jgi:hypothetical protein
VGSYPRRKRYAHVSQILAGLRRVPLRNVISGEAIEAWPQAPDTAAASRDLLFLKQTAREVMREFSGWTEAEATHFTLTDEPPNSLRGRATLAPNHIIPTLGTIQIEVSPLLDPKEVAGLYQRIRKKLPAAGE